MNPTRTWIPKGVSRCALEALPAGDGQPGSHRSPHIPQHSLAQLELSPGASRALHCPRHLGSAGKPGPASLDSASRVLWIKHFYHFSSPSTKKDLTSHQLFVRNLFFLICVPAREGHTCEDGDMDKVFALFAQAWSSLQLVLAQIPVLASLEHWALSERASSTGHR